MYINITIIILASFAPGGEACIPIAATLQLRPLASIAVNIALLFAAISCYMYIKF